MWRKLTEDRNEMDRCYDNVYNEANWDLVANLDRHFSMPLCIREMMFTCFAF